MTEIASFPFVPAATWRGEPIFMPLLPLELCLDEGPTIRARALVDTGASVNVLPYDIGLRLGAIWEQQRRSIPLTGNLASAEARSLFVHVRIGKFAPILLAFAWTRSNDAPLLLGQVNFFHKFDAHFQALRRQFHLQPANDAERAA